MATKCMFVCLNACFGYKTNEFGYKCENNYKKQKVLHHMMKAEGIFYYVSIKEFLNSSYKVITQK